MLEHVAPNDGTGIYRVGYDAVATHLKYNSIKASQYGYCLFGVRYPDPTHFRTLVHIVENHDDLAGYYDDVVRVIEDPDLVITGYRGSQIAVRGYGRDRYLVVVYQELSSSDGFVITAYFTSTIDRRKAIWKR